MESSAPRVLMVSRRAVEPHVSWSNAYEFEDTVCEIDDVVLAVTEPIQAKPSALEDKVMRRVRKATGVVMQRRPRLETIEVDRDYDLFFARIMTPYFFDHVAALKGWQQRCRIKACWIEELWPVMLENKEWLQPLRQFDHVFVSNAESAKVLAEAIDTPCSYISFSVDTKRFCPYPDPVERTIDFYLMGRRSPITHQSLRRYAQQRKGFMYLYDSMTPGYLVEGHADHRDLMASLIQRSRYFLADRAKANEPNFSLKSHVFGPRFFEGSAAGAVLIGEEPKSQEFEQCFDWPGAVISFPHGGAHIGEIIDELDREPERIDAIRTANVVNALRRHDSVYRWVEILETLGLSPRPSAATRSRKLSSMASKIESA